MRKWRRELHFYDPETAVATPEVRSPSTRTPPKRSATAPTKSLFATVTATDILSKEAFPPLA
jgi:hypothetical protein